VNVKLIEKAKAKGHPKLNGVVNAYILNCYLVTKLERRLEDFIKTGILDDSVAENCACPKIKGKSSPPCPFGRGRKTLNTGGR
jgi:hypothetical protein